MLWEPRNNRSKRGRERNLSRYSSISLGPGTWIQHLSVFVSRSGAVQLLKYYWWSTMHTSNTSAPGRKIQPSHPYHSDYQYFGNIAVVFVVCIPLATLNPCLIVSMRTHLDWDNVGLKSSQPSFTTRYILTVEKCKLTTWSWSQKQKMDCWSQTKAESKMRMFSISSRVSN